MATKTSAVEIYDEVQGTPGGRQAGFNYEDLLAFPEDNLRREIIGGELIVTAAPSGRHQDVVLELGATLLAYTKEHGGKVYVAPRDVFFSESDVVEPDVVFVRAENADKVEEAFVRGAPDIVVEVSSPTTRKLELKRKLDLYQGYGVPEYWYVDLDADRVEIYSLAGGKYGTPSIYGRDDTFTSPRAQGLSIEVRSILPQR